MRNGLRDSLQDCVELLLDELVVCDVVVEVYQCDVDRLSRLPEGGVELFVPEQPESLSCSSSEQYALHGVADFLFRYGDKESCRRVVGLAESEYCSERECDGALACVEEGVDACLSA